MTPLIYVLMCLAEGPGSLDLTADERFWRDEQSCVVVRNNLQKECACVPFAPGSNARTTVTVNTHDATPVMRCDDQGRYFLTEIGETLRADSPQSVPNARQSGLAVCASRHQRVLAVGIRFSLSNGGKPMLKTLLATVAIVGLIAAALRALLAGR